MTDTPRPAGLRDVTPPPPAGTGVRLTATPATDTTRPDPRVVACPVCAARAGEPCRNDRVAEVAWIHPSRRDRALEPRPLTVADIPGGQGPASLFLMPFNGGEMAVQYKAAEDEFTLIMCRPPDRAAGHLALWDHLAATLPHVTDGEA